jgi:hypothetical protein
MNRDPKAPAMPERTPCIRITFPAAADDLLLAVVVDVAVVCVLDIAITPDVAVPPDVVPLDPGTEVKLGPT